jgi:hypothetical protein
MEDPLSTSSDPQSPGHASGRTQPTTQEIPLVAPPVAPATQHLPPHPGASTPAPMDGPQPTERVDFIPSLSGAGMPPPPPVPAHAQVPDPEGAAAHAAPEAVAAPEAAAAPGPTQSWPESLEDQLLAAGRGKSKRRRAGGGLHRTALAGLVLAAVAVVLLELGLTLDFGGESYWSAVTLWSAFATVAGLLALAAVSPAGGRLGSRGAGRVAVGGLVGLAVFWLLVVLPDVATDRGFLLTAALGCLGAAVGIARTKD